MDSAYNRPTRILVECAELLPSARLGVLAPLEPLQEAGFCEVQFKETAKVVGSDIEWCDILVCVRGFWVRSLRLIEAAKQHQRLAVYFLDDDLLGIPEDVPSGKYLRTKQVQKTMREIITSVDVLWLVNEHLAEKMRQWFFGKVVISSVPVELRRNVATKDKPTRILYAGSTDHKALLDKLIVPALKRVYSNSNNKIMVDIIGPELDEDLSFIRNIPYFDDYEDYERHIINTGYHIGLAPIRLEEFYRCKFYNKFLEYSSFGIAGIYTRSEPYSLVVEERINGFYCDNTIESWAGEIQRVAGNDNERHACAEAAQALLKEKFTFISVSKNLRSELGELLDYKAPSKANIKIMRDYGFFGHYLFICKIIWLEEGVRAVPTIIGKILRFIGKSIRGVRR